MRPHRAAQETLPVSEKRQRTVLLAGERGTQLWTAHQLQLTQQWQRFVQRVHCLRVYWLPTQGL